MDRLSSCSISSLVRHRSSPTRANSILLRRSAPSQSTVSPFGCLTTTSVSCPDAAGSSDASIVSDAQLARAAAPEPEFEAQPARNESSNPTEQPRQPVAREEGQRGRGRRRRGGRGRGGRGREQAVAQAFSPAAKGIIPDLPVQQ